MAACGPLPEALVFAQDMPGPDPADRCRAGSRPLPGPPLMSRSQVTASGPRWAWKLGDDPLALGPAARLYIPSASRRRRGL